MSCTTLGHQRLEEQLGWHRQHLPILRLESSLPTSADRPIRASPARQHLGSSYPSQRKLTERSRRLIGLRPPRYGFPSRACESTMIGEEDLISTVRIALANIRVPTTPDDSVRLATSAVADAGRRGAAVICFPECFVPGYRWPGTKAPPPDPAVPRARVGRCGGCRQSCPHRGDSGHGARHRPRPADHRVRDQSGRHDRGVAGQGPDRPVGGRHLSRARDRASCVHAPGR